MFLAPCTAPGAPLFDLGPFVRHPRLMHNYGKNGHFMTSNPIHKPSTLGSPNGVRLPELFAKARAF